MNKDDTVRLLDNGAIAWIDICELARRLKSGIPLVELRNYESAQTATNISVWEHFQILRTCKAIRVIDGVVRSR